MASGPFVHFGHSQAVGGTISGTVKDQQGAVIPGSEVKATNVATGIVSSTVSNSDGLYRLGNVQPGVYNLSVTAPGFTEGLKNNLTVNVGAQLVVDFPLNVAGVSQSVEVTGQAPAVDVVTSSLNYEVNATTMREVPLNGRDVTQLAALQPSVEAIGTAGGIRASLGNKISVSGSRPSENNFLFDGINMMDSGQNTPGSILGVTLGVDAIDQFQLLTNSFSAEYGRAAGGVLNALTRSGTNSLHGSGFYFGRNSALDAVNFFTLPGRVPVFRRSQFGGTAGGPIKKDKMFWFFDYEGIRQALGTPAINQVPSQAIRNGTYINPTTNAVTNYTISPATAPILALYPLPNAGLIGNGDTGNFNADLNSIGAENYYMGRIDDRISDKDSIHGSFFIDRGASTVPDIFLHSITEQPSNRQTEGIEYTRIISPTVLEVGRIGFSRTTYTSGITTQVLDQAILNPAFTFVPGLQMGSTSVSGLGTLAAAPKGLDYTYANWNSFQGYDSVYITRGTHALKMGFNVERMDYNTSQPNLSGGSWTYGSIPGFLTNGLQGTNPSLTFGATELGSNDSRGIRETLYGGFLQDDWRVKSRLTVNLGLRYEMTTVPTENPNLIALVPTLLSTAVKTGGPTQTSNATTKDFEPRIGFAWDVFGNGKTAIRAGAGLFDDLPLPYLYDTEFFRSLPYFVQGSITNTTVPALYGSYPGGGYGLITNGTLRTAWVNPNPRRSYSPQWNFNIEQKLGAWALTVGYVGSRGIHLAQVDRNMDDVQPTRTPYGYWYPPAGSVPRLNPNFAAINCTLDWDGDSYYDALHISMSRSFARGLQVISAFAWGKSIDDTSTTSSTTAGSGYGNGTVGNPAPLFPGINRGYSDFDVRANGTISWVYDEPGFKMSFAPSPVRAVLTGWELSSIFHMQSGLHFTPYTATIPNAVSDDTASGLGGRPDLVSSAACANPVQTGNLQHYINTSCFYYPAPVTINGVTGEVLGNISRNALTGPGITNIDLSFIKNFKVKERITAQLRFEFFNILNHPNFSNPNGNMFDSSGNPLSTAGLISATSTSQRELQYGLKISF